MFLFLFFAVGILGLTIALITGIKSYKDYINSEYYQITRTSYLKMWSDKGRSGEYSVYKALWNLKGYRKYLFNCYIPKTDGTTTEADIVMIHESGIYVFESKNYSGWIFGTETQREWTQTLPAGRGKSRKEHFFNPIMQNSGHIKWLQSYLKDFRNLKFYSYIVFGNGCELKNVTLTSGGYHVVKREDVLEAVAHNAHSVTERMSESLINDIYEKLYPLTQMDESGKSEHIENIKRRYDKTFSPKPAAEPQNKKCPRCGGQLVLKTARKGNYAGNKFYGCSNYPDCKYIENMGE